MEAYRRPRRSSSRVALTLDTSVVITLRELGALHIPEELSLRGYQAII